MLCDYHLHTFFSGDSRQTLEELCESAIEKGIEELCITDHEDRSWPKNNPNFVIENFDIYFQSIEQCRRQFSDKLRIRTGLEIGLHEKRMREYTALIKNWPFDFIIGSLHEIEGYQVHHPAYLAGKSKEALYRTYYDTLRYFVEHYDCFNVVGHLDYVRRYMPFPYQKEDLTLAFDALENLLGALIKTGIGIECNTSGFHHESKEPLPSTQALCRYREMGGEILTIGSDAHRSRDVGFGIKTAHRLLRDCGFTHFYRFKGTEPIPTPLIRNI